MNLSNTSLGKNKAIAKATYSQSTLRFYVHNSQHSFIEDGISHVFTCFCISGNLGKRKISNSNTSKADPLCAVLQNRQRNFTNPTYEHMPPAAEFNPAEQAAAQPKLLRTQNRKLKLLVNLSDLTCASISFIASLESSSFRPKILSNRRIRTYLTKQSKEKLAGWWCFTREPCHAP